MFLPHVKICGITRRSDALFCANAGAGALGAVFYAKSPRHVTAEQARELFDGLPPDIARVGVFVNTPLDAMLQTARDARLDTLQLHGDETADTCSALLREGFHVVRVLKTTGDELLASARALPPCAGILVECGKGILPGGNAAIWDWSKAAPLADFRPFAIAGGLHPDNLAVAARVSRAAAFDASSGVESAPGVKDEAAVRAFLRAAAERPPPARLFSWKSNP